MPAFRQKPLNSQMKLWESLDKADVRREKGLFLAEGFKVVSELMRSACKVHALLIMEEKKERWKDLLNSLDEGAETYSLTASQWRKLSQDKKSEGIIAVAAPFSISDVSLLPEGGRILLAHKINNPNNLGALARTAHWFGFSALLLSKGSADFTNPKAIRASMGSLFHITVIPDLDFDKVLLELKKRYFLVAGHSQKGIPPHPCRNGAALLLGSESHGLPENLADEADEMWHIPGGGGAESLSLPQAAAIMMYEAAQKTPQAKGGL